ncbi:hypothetical protein PILCRDRAFT_80789 [Piloderma croceum F 1598]|uniref:Uncharacterized protein n=1 Tax=Piloderma croceum (strain F 1598) TaxID=765440 RepID=A0A0C3EMF1_PILCF|nr:hypothetical protein PILCRDRAFT_80789 [Piloderma croceum F 1598]
MHLVALNLPDLLLSLWRGTIDCDKTDNHDSWDWAVLKGDVWKTHGAAVAAMTPYLPGSFDRPPRNPAEKINSGFKAWEFLIYVFGLGPGLFYKILPEKYWKNYCKLVFAIRIVHQQEILTADLTQAHPALIEFVTEFEELYYQRRVDRLHFVRPALHSTLHLASEVPRVGPGLCGSQWTVERTIGNLGEEIRQPSNPYANLSQRGLRRCQINALKAMLPKLEPNNGGLPRGARDIGNGYVLLRAKEDTARPVRQCEVAAFRAHLGEEGQNMPDNWCPCVRRWARLRLPNGQTARSGWKEDLKPLEKVRMARNVKLELNGKLEFAEVRFYLCLDEENTVALVSMYSPPDLALLEASHYTLWTCTYQGDAGLRVINAKAITAVVAMVPLPGAENLRFVVEKPGLDIAHMGGNDEIITNE